MSDEKKKGTLGSINAYLALLLGIPAVVFGLFGLCALIVRFGVSALLGLGLCYGAYLFWKKRH